MDLKRAPGHGRAPRLATWVTAGRLRIAIDPGRSERQEGKKALASQF